MSSHTSYTLFTPALGPVGAAKRELLSRWICPLGLGNLRGEHCTAAAATTEEKAQRAAALNMESVEILWEQSMVERQYERQQSHSRTNVQPLIGRGSHLLTHANLVVFSS